MFIAKRFIAEASGMVSEGIDPDTAVSHVCFRHRLGWLERQDILDAVLHARHAVAEQKVKPPIRNLWFAARHATPEQAAAARACSGDNT